MINVGIVGFGFMGRMHLSCYKKRDDVKIAAICDADIKRLHDSGGTKGNVAGAEKPPDLSGIELFPDFDRMLDKAKLDAVSITLPTYLHTDFSCRALDSGIHVLCEKPMALNVKECDRMIRSARKNDKVLQIGHCIRFWPEYVKTKEIIDGGQYGRVLALSMRRLSATPKWSHENWLLNEQRSGGVVLDLHIHDTDYAQYLFGQPKAVCSFGPKMPSGGFAHIMTQFIYDDGKAVFAEGGWMLAPAFGFEMSFNMVLESATIQFDSTRKPAFRICPAEGEVITPKMECDNGYDPQIGHFIRSVKGEQVPPIVTLEGSRNSVRIAEAEKESAETGKIVNL